jgi:hypothetical protein
MILTLKVPGGADTRNHPRSCSKTETAVAADGVEESTWRSSVVSPAGNWAALPHKIGGLDRVEAASEKRARVSGKFEPVAASPDGRWLTVDDMSGELGCVRLFDTGDAELTHPQALPRETRG